MSTQYNDTIRKYSHGWKTWHSDSVLSHVHIPDGVGVRLFVKDYSISPLLENLYLSYQNPETSGDARAAACAYDGSYTDLTVTWRKSVIRIQTACWLPPFKSPTEPPHCLSAVLCFGIPKAPSSAMMIP